MKAVPGGVGEPGAMRIALCNGVLPPPMKASAFLYRA